MRKISILSAAAVALVLAAPLSAYAARGQEDSGTGPSYNDTDPRVTALEHDYQAILAQEHASPQQTQVSQGSSASQTSTK